MRRAARKSLRKLRLIFLSWIQERKKDQRRITGAVSQPLTKTHPQSVRVSAMASVRSVIDKVLKLVSLMQDNVVDSLVMMHE